MNNNVNRTNNLEANYEHVIDIFFKRSLDLIHFIK